MSSSPSPDMAVPNHTAGDSPHPAADGAQDTQSAAGKPHRATVSVAAARRAPAELALHLGSRPRPAKQPLSERIGRLERRRNPRLGRGKSILTWPILSWCLWDLGASAFNTVVTTFVFTVYLASKSFGDPAANESAISLGLTIAGLLIALLAPITGQRSDRAGRAVRSLGIYTFLVVAICACLFFVQPAPRYLWLGIILLGLGNIFYELASVNYNGLLTHLAARERVGAVSGLGWGMGYLGGIVLLLLLFVGFINPDVTWFGQTNTHGIGVRTSMVIAAVWFGVAALPVLAVNSGKRARRKRRILREKNAGGDPWAGAMEGEPTVPTDIRAAARPRESIIQSYKRLWRTLVGLYRQHPSVLWFLAAAAIFRDGLAGIFTYGGIIAQNTFGFSSGEVIMFAVVASLVAGIFTIIGGRLDDRLGPRAVIIGSLVIISGAGACVFIFHSAGKAAFWGLGLFLAGCVGPAQSAARSFLARIIPAGREGEIFGLYATTGRAVSFLAPALYGAFIAVGHRVTGGAAGYWGILGILVVLLAGLALMTKVGQPDRHIPALD